MEHLAANFSGLHRAKLRRGTATARPAPRGTGDIYYAEDTEELSIADDTGSSWNTYKLTQIGAVTTLVDLSDVDSAAQTANYVLTTPDGSTGNYSGRALVADDIPSFSANKLTGTLGETDGGLNMTAYDPGDLIVADGANSLNVLPIGANGNYLTIDTGLSPPLKWAALSGGGGGTNFQGARVYNSGGLSVDHATTTTLVWDTEVYDVGGLWDIGDPERMTIQQDGKYHATMHLYSSTEFMNPEADFLRLYIRLLSTIRGWDRIYSYGPATLSLSCTLDCVATDYVYVQLWQATGGSMSFVGTEDCGFMVEKIS